MTFTVINSNVVGADNLVSLLTGDQFIVNQGASFITWSTGFDAGVFGLLGSSGVGVTILGNFIAVEIDLFGGDRVMVGRLGTVQVSSPEGVCLFADQALGATNLINEGSIHSGFAAGSDAITVTVTDAMALGGFAFNLNNTGLIQATSAALFMTGTGKAHVVNSGTINGALTVQDVAVTLENTGTIIGQIYLGDGADLVVNAGSISGDIDTGAGNDVIDLRHGRLLGNHSVYGGTGDDTYYVDRADVTLIETSGLDTVHAGVSLRLAAGIENLVLLAGAQKGTGNDDSNTLTGNGDDNRLSGELGNDSLSGLSGDDVLVGDQGSDLLEGGADNDRLYGGQATDRLYGGDGEDLLVGGAGRDSLYGGADADTFVFTRLNHSPAASADVIYDFTTGEDLIDLKAIDAIGNNAIADDAFIFIGTAAFSNVAGQMRFEIIGITTWLRMDVNGDSLNDMAIRLQGTPVLSAGDFVL